MDFGRFTIFWHIQDEGVPFYPNHAHCDSGSFVLYIDGVPFFVDPGRFCYDRKGIGWYGISSRSHNVLLIDGFEPFVYDTKFPEFYRRSNINISWEDRDEYFIFAIEHNGFARLLLDMIYRDMGISA